MFSFSIAHDTAFFITNTCRWKAYHVLQISSLIDCICKQKKLNYPSVVYSSLFVCYFFLVNTPITHRFCVTLEHDLTHSLPLRSAYVHFPPTTNPEHSCHFSESARSVMSLQQTGFKELESMSILSITALHTPKG